MTAIIGHIMDDSAFNNPWHCPWCCYFLISCDLYTIANTMGWKYSILISVLRFIIFHGECIRINMRNRSHEVGIFWNQIAGKTLNLDPSSISNVHVSLLLLRPVDFPRAFLLLVLDLNIHDDHYKAQSIHMEDRCGIY